MKQVKLVSILICGMGILLPNLLQAQLNFNGSRGLTYVHSAWTLEPGFLTLSGHSRLFGKSANFSGQSSKTITDISGRLNINYGAKNHLEIIISPLLYQDTNFEGSKVNAPDDLFLSAKIGSFNSTGSSMAYGLLVSARFPTGFIHNVPFEPYATNRVGFGLMGLLSYSKNAYYPDDATSIHVNLGYWFHNDVGAELIKGAGPESEPTSMSMEFLYGIGIIIPKEKLSFSAELYGNAFTQSPPPVAYSRENYLYFSPAVKYKANEWMTLTFGFDVRVTNSKDKTLYSSSLGGVNLLFPNSQPNYPAWRINLGTNFTLISTTVTRVDEREILMQKAQSRRDLFEQILKDKRETEAAEEELERIRAERIRAEKELERLRKILEGEEKKSANKDDEKSKQDKKDKSKKSKKKKENN